MTDHVIVVGLGYGDEGKGSVVDFLCRTQRVDAVIRFNGGAQAAHNVVTDDGRHHTFSQWGAGTLAGVPTHLSRFMLVDPFRMSAEAAHLEEIGVGSPWGLITVDRDASLTTVFHREANRERERRRGVLRHGSCGVGIGETVAYRLAHPADAPIVGDCGDRQRLSRKLYLLADWFEDEFGFRLDVSVDDNLDGYEAFAQECVVVDDRFTRRLLHQGPSVFEGAQGVLLDERYGFHPYTTWSNTTPANAKSLLTEAGLADEAFVLGVLRTTTTRHGPGPLVTEDQQLVSSMAEVHNGFGEWQGGWRVGHFDAVAHRYAVKSCGGVNGIALTRMDDSVNKVCTSYRHHQDGPDQRVEVVRNLPMWGDHQDALTALLQMAVPMYQDLSERSEWRDFIEAALGTIKLESWGPTATDKTSKVLR